MSTTKANNKISCFYSIINKEFAMNDLDKTAVMTKGFLKALRSIQTKNQAIHTLSNLPVDLKPLFSEAWKISIHEPTECLNTADFLSLWSRYSSIERIDFDFSYLSIEHLVAFLNILKRQSQHLIFIEEFLIPITHNTSMQLAC